MSELRFRAWDKKANKYRPILLIHYNEDGIFAVDLESDDGKDTISLFGDEVLLELFTGLHDKNGKEIYEGDIVKVNNGYVKYGWAAGEKYQVYFAYGGFRTVPKYGKYAKGYWIDDGKDFKVIGNIHENADIL